MALSSQDIGGLIFKPTIQPNLGKMALDGMSLGLLMQFDGKKTLDRVARQLAQTPSDIRPVVSKLLKAKLIQPVNTIEKAVDREFMEYLVSRLSIAIGPLGRIIVEDGLEILGFTDTTLPAGQAAELINLLSGEIPREEQRTRFKQDMLQKIRDKNYL